MEGMFMEMGMIASYSLADLFYDLLCLLWMLSLIYQFFLKIIYLFFDYTAGHVES